MQGRRSIMNKHHRSLKKNLCMTSRGAFVRMIGSLIKNADSSLPLLDSPAALRSFWPGGDRRVQISCIQFTRRDHKINMSKCLCLIFSCRFLQQLVCFILIKVSNKPLDGTSTIIISKYKRTASQIIILQFFILFCFLFRLENRVPFDSISNLTDVILL